MMSSGFGRRCAMFFVSSSSSFFLFFGRSFFSPFCAALGRVGQRGLVC